MCSEGEGGYEGARAGRWKSRAERQVRMGMRVWVGGRVCAWVGGCKPRGRCVCVSVFGWVGGYVRGWVGVIWEHLQTEQCCCETCLVHGSQPVQRQIDDS
jgi:hypothetical protein